MNNSGRPSPGKDPSRNGHPGDPVSSGRRRRKPGTTAGTRRVLIRFVVASLIVELVLGLGGVIAGREAAKDESTSDARRVTNVLARSVVTPNLTDGLLHTDPASIRQLDRVIIGRVTGRQLVRVKLWLPQPGGLFRVVYSDEHRLIGSVFQLADDEEEALVEGRTDADLSDVSRPENRFERGQGKLLEVYRPVRTPNGTALLFETYGKYSVVTARAARIWREFIPITLGALLLLQLVQLPLAWSMARRLDGTLQERDRLAERVAEASETERRRIAGDLHDGVVQDLAATSFALVGAIDYAERTGDRSQAEVLQGAGDAIRGSIRSLRTLLVDIYPPSLQRAGLASALKDLLAPLKAREIDARLAIPEAIPVGRQASEVTFRVAKEALRNVISHSKATSVELLVALEGDQLVLTVKDDGIGFDMDALTAAPAGGHVGLQLLRDLVHAAGGTLEVSSSPGAGTRVRMEVSQR